VRKKTVLLKYKNNEVVQSTVIFIFFAIIIFIITYFTINFEWKDVLVEGYGFLLDMLVFGIFILWLNKKKERSLLIKSYENEIDDFRNWESDEAKHRIAGCIKRLNREGVTRIDCSFCFLKGVNLSKAELQVSDFSGANLEGAILENVNFEEAIFFGTNLKGANLNNVNFKGAGINYTCLEGATIEGTDFKEATVWESNLKIEQVLDYALGEESGMQDDEIYKHVEKRTADRLCEAETLYKSKMNETLLRQIQKKCPHLLEKPKKEK